MAWSDLPPRNRAVTRAAIFLVIVIVISIVWNAADEQTAALITPQDVFMALIGAAIYAGIMYVVDMRLIHRSKRDLPAD